jgi:hypothetical protein
MGVVLLEVKKTIIKLNTKSYMVAYAYNPSIWKVKAEDH